MPDKAEIEAVARAIVHTGTEKWDDLEDMQQHGAKVVARAAIDALDAHRNQDGE